MGNQCCQPVNNINLYSLDIAEREQVNFDRTYRQIRDLIGKAHVLQQLVAKCRRQAHALTNISLTKTQGLLQNLQVLIWCISYSCRGLIKQSGFIVTPIPPYISAETIEVPLETQELMSCLKLFLETVMRGPKKIKRLTEKLENHHIELKKWKESVSPWEHKKVNWDFQYKRFMQEIRDIQALEEDLKSIAVKIDWIIQNTQEYVYNADEIGYQAYKEGLSTPRDIVTRFRGSLDGDHRKVLVRVRAGSQSESQILENINEKKGIGLTLPLNKVTDNLMESQTTALNSGERKINSERRLKSSRIFDNSQGIVNTQDSSRNLLTQTMDMTKSGPNFEATTKSKIIVNKGGKESNIWNSKPPLNHGSKSTRDFLQLGPKRSPFLVDCDEVQIGISKVFTETDMNRSVNLKIPKARSSLIFEKNKVRVEMSENINDNGEDDSFMQTIQSTEIKHRGYTKKLNTSRI